jgi:putative nucleotidyltransferase with HDIG domain
MKRLAMHDVTPGMVLEAPVRDQKGRLLIPAGERMTEKYIRICKIWGASEIWVQSSRDIDSEPSGGEEDIPAPVWGEAERRVGEHFAANDLHDAFVHELFRIATRKKAKGIHSRQDSSIPSSTSLSSQSTAAVRYTHSTRRSITVQSLISNRMRLPSLPDIYHKTIQSIYNVDIPIAEIAQIISKDTTLSAKVLQLVNSSFYGLLNPVETLTHALALIGTNQLMTILTGVSVVSVFKNVSTSLLHMRQFWEHSVACGIVCRQLASYMNGVVNSERYFVGGLLHDIGRLAMMQAIADDMARSMARSKVYRLPLYQAEKEVLGIDHAQTGAHLAHVWNLPAPLERMIHFHHQPDGKKNIDPAVVYVADFIVTALQIGFSGNEVLPIFDNSAWNFLELNTSIIDSVVYQLDNQLNDTFALIYGT